ncbi:ABC transporter related protein [Thioalkalivibrio nitratireducens DSM 14787]|uniref:ABC transporter related protein n=1 Tax=Thioalkalivibrio nitratireducens (strain DSM 14787 / UNIQEM 213 / ALEN2) TaxID=1255043 RepID=L0E0M6_THIND|nr:ATP-binding cassette domain-containing protein [Thioalkalivibrio nitratireducens]AGA34802.1 ABC transporter related protein [Thioalkalivibrio nitratireducens DSM 14787]
MPQSARPVLSCTGVRVGFDRPLLGPLDLRLGRGERMVLTGPNGAGKSLLLRALIGQARVFGGRVDRLPRTTTCLLAQEHPRPALWPLSGQDWFRALGAGAPAHGPVRELLPHRLDRLSGGQWQLLRLAAVLHTSADVLLLDEPANHLDAEVRDSALGLLQSLPPQTAVLMTSHDTDFLAGTGFPAVPLAELL